MALLLTASFLFNLVLTLFGDSYGQDIAAGRYYITPDLEKSCGEDHVPCLTLDQFAAKNINESVTLFLIPGHHSLTRKIEILSVDSFTILANTSVRIQCIEPNASFLFEGIFNLEIKNTAIVSCGSGSSSGALQVRSVQMFNISCVTLQESFGISLSVQDSNGLVTGARFIGNTGAGMNITNSTIAFDGNNTFSDNLNGGIASYNSILQFNGVNQFSGNKATSGGGISAISSTINCSGNMIFEKNSAEQYGGGVYASGTRMTIEVELNFISNTANEAGGGIHATTSSSVYISGSSNFVSNLALTLGGGVCATDRAALYVSGTSNFFNDSAWMGGGVYVENNAKVYISGIGIFLNNTAKWFGGGVLVSNATFDFSGAGKFLNNSAHWGGGVSASDAYTVVSISGTSDFVENSAYIGGGVHVIDYATVYITETVNFIHNSAQQYGGGVYSHWSAAVHISGISNFIGNSVQGEGGGVFAWSRGRIDISGTTNFISNLAKGIGGGVCAVDNATVDIRGTINFTNNSAQYGGGVYARIKAAVYINGTSNFMNNLAQWFGGGVCANNDGTAYIIGMSNFLTNSAEYGGGVAALYGSEVLLRGSSSFTRNSARVRGGGMYVETSSVTSNGDTIFSESSSQYGGGVSLVQSEMMLVGNTAFLRNSASYGGALLAVETRINITGNESFTKNLATVNGGALALAGGSVIYILEAAFLTFTENSANSFGGAVFIEENSAFCSYDWNINGFLGLYDSNETDMYNCKQAEINISLCFDELISFKQKINISFSGNSALAGSIIFGGEIDKTISNIKFMTKSDMYSATVADLFRYLFNINIDDTNEQPAISSNPDRICRCTDGKPDCSDPPSPYQVSVYPGQTVGVSLVAVGQRYGTVPATITAQYDTDDGATFGDFQSTQTSNSTCTMLRYTIFSTKKTEEFQIYTEGACGDKSIPLSVNVTLLECPIGFNSSNQCICEERLQKYTNSCNISTQAITRTASDNFWVGVDNTNGLILHPHCPFDYCTTGTVSFTLVEGTDIPLTDTIIPTNASMNNSSDTSATMNQTDVIDHAIGNNTDAQCNYNRSGLLCGKCQKGLSLVFGSSKCLKCSNSYLSLLIAFALAGVILVIFLLILNLTVAVGTINGLIFYANIVLVNRAQLFPSSETNVLTVFISWVNLDLGIETCFFDGMDAYSKAWLQYAFPVYVWVLVGSTILMSRHSMRMARCLGTNPVAVLATLFLLSYTKLLRSIINPLFVTFLEYPSDSKAVWLVDGNVPYLIGHHTPLFITSLLALLLLFFPFTLLLLLGQWIQAQSERKCCSWISDYRISTFLDVFHGPFKNKHRYWCGLLLVTRFCLFLVFTFNVNRDPSINILATAVCLIGLQTIVFQFNIYKAWYLNVLEASFILNLLVLANGTYYVVTSGGNQNALTYTSVSVAFATFCGIIGYHFYLQIKDSTLYKKLIQKFIHGVKPSANETVAEDDCDKLLKEDEDPPRKYSEPPTTSIVDTPHNSITSLL